LRDVVVRIQNGTAGKHDPPATAVLIDQKDCMYTPRVVGIIAGQKLQVRNSDSTFHNVWGVVANKDLFNKPQSPKAATSTSIRRAAKADDVVELKCGVHAWMHAYVAVHDHPYFAVTGSDGMFEIKGLPQGTYTLESMAPHARHEVDDGRDRQGQARRRHRTVLVQGDRALGAMLLG
jgi:hypothetical protein